MIQLLHFALLTLGITYIVTQSSIMILPRMWLASKSSLARTFIYCPACVGFWVGTGVELGGNFGMHPLQAGISACGLMATWTLAFLHTSSWNLEQEDAPQETQPQPHKD